MINIIKAIPSACINILTIFISKNINAKNDILAIKPSKIKIIEFTTTAIPYFSVYLWTKYENTGIKYIGDGKITTIDIIPNSKIFESKKDRKYKPNIADKINTIYF